ncbi:MAG: ComF family protein [Undibacterium sp.]|nr:ComF family protein [Opitutaceae bacterium]
MPALRELLRGLGDVVFPPACVACRGVVEGSGFKHLCVKCAGQLDFVHAPSCTTCGSPFYGVMEGERICPHCDGLHPAFGTGCTAVLFKGPARALVIELKYHRGLHVLADIETIFRRSPEVMAHIADAVLVPVPLHPRKARERGYNQSALLAAVLARVSGGRVEELLRRDVDTQTQTAFDRKTRQANLKNAFALARGATLTAGQKYVLVDDVFTTGSTLNSCARVLRGAGALSLDVVTFAHG